MTQTVEERKAYQKEYQLRPGLSKFKKMLDITRQQAGKKRLKDNYLTAEGLPKF